MNLGNLKNAAALVIYYSWSMPGGGGVKNEFLTFNAMMINVASHFATESNIIAKLNSKW